MGFNSGFKGLKTGSIHEFLFRQMYQGFLVLKKERDGTWRIKTSDELDELIRYEEKWTHKM